MHPEASRTLGKWFRRFLMFALPVVAGIVILTSLQKSRGAPDRVEIAELATPVRIVTAKAISATPRILGFGTVRPGESWRAIARVSGEIVGVNEGLGTGTFVDKGEVLFRIDDTDYKLAVANATAAVETVRANLAELQKTVENTQALLSIEEKNLRLARQDLDRQTTLRARGDISQTSLDSAERDFNLRQRTVQELRNSLALAPSQIAALEAQLAQQTAQLAVAQLDLARTVVQAPFAGRVSEENISTGQVVSKGETALTLDSIDLAEVEAEVQIARAQILFDANAFSTLGTITSETAQRFLQQANLTATVRVRSGDTAIEWPGRVSRLRGSLDAVARTLGIIVAVDDPYAQARPGERPPLVAGMYAEVEISGAPRKGLIAVPRNAVHDGHVYLLDPEDRLRPVEVELAYLQGDLALIGGGLSEDDRVVVSDLAPAIAGMKLTPVLDDRLAEDVAARAGGAGPVR